MQQELKSSNGVWGGPRVLVVEDNGAYRHGSREDPPGT
jgi:hypothetical protein